MKSYEVMGIVADALVILFVICAAAALAIIMIEQSKRQEDTVLDEQLQPKKRGKILIRLKNDVSSEAANLDEELEKMTEDDLRSEKGNRKLMKSDYLESAAQYLQTAHDCLEKAEKLHDS